MSQPYITVPVFPLRRDYAAGEYIKLAAENGKNIRMQFVREAKAGDTSVDVVPDQRH